MVKYELVSPNSTSKSFRCPTNINPAVIFIEIASGPLSNSLTYNYVYMKYKTFSTVAAKYKTFMATPSQTWYSQTA